ncbi:MAG: basic amino acid ABC transporter substrate-binding protein [Lachnospiraceae bacterium]
MKKFSKLAVSMLTVVMLACGCGGAATTEQDGEQQVTGQESSTLEADKLIVGTNAEFPPFEYVDDNGEFDGFDIAVMKEVGERLGKETVISNMEFKSLIGSMESGALDVIAAGMTVTDERKQSVDFSDSYYTSNQYIIVQKDSDITGIEQLNGKKLAVQEGTTGDFVASGEYGTIADAEVKRFKKGVDAVMELKNGAVDAVIIDANPAKEFVKANDDLKLIEDHSSEEEYAFAVQKGNQELLDQINETLAEMKEDGTFDALIEQYINE